MDEPIRVEMQVEMLGYWMPVNLRDGVPQCSHGDQMIETKPGEWMCPDGAAALAAVAPAMLRLDAVIAELITDLRR